MINENFLKLKSGYLFPIIERKTREFAAANPGVRLLRLGVGDAALGLPRSVVSAMESAAGEMAERATFRGYGPEVGYEFLRDSVREYYARRRVKIANDEIFISDGAGSDLGNILDIFAAGITAVIPNPAYPAYADTNVIAGNKIVFAVGSAENDFLPMPDKSVRADLIYLCSPNNPTGAVYNRAQLAQWVEYANSIGAVIIYDAAYEAFISGRAIPTSIFQIAGAEKCAIEICSLSKTAGFTGVRCGWTTVPHGLVRGGVELNALWNRRQTTKTNGVSYVVQRAAQAALAPEGVRETRKNILYYRRNARLMMRFLTEIGVEFVGGKDAPYVWLKCPNGMTSWGFFDFMLARFGIVGTAGVGFGSAGEGYLRLSAFAARETIAEAIKRVKDQGFC